MLIVAFKIELLLLFNVIVIIIDRSDPDLQVQFFGDVRETESYRCKYHPNLVLIQYGIKLIQNSEQILFISSSVEAYVSSKGLL